MSAPRLARWLLSRVTSRDERDDVLADLEEEAAALEQTRGASRRPALVPAADVAIARSAVAAPAQHARTATAPRA